jgi:hypothetical protein
LRGRRLPVKLVIKVRLRRAVAPVVMDPLMVDQIWEFRGLNIAYDRVVMLKL